MEFSLFSILHSSLPPAPIYKKNAQLNSFQILLRRTAYRKIPKISPSIYKPLKIVTQKNPPLNRPFEYKPPGGLYMEFALEYKVKQSKNGKFPSHYKLKLAQLISKLQFPSVHKPLRILAPPKISPSKRAFEKYKPRGLFS